MFESELIYRTKEWVSIFLTISPDTKVQLMVAENDGQLDCIVMEFEVGHLTLVELACIARQYDFIRFEPVDEKRIAIRCKYAGE